ncbi:MAG TPA: 3-dehydroquinate synthase [Deinococcales bacterium]|nr:3-dehydroquinate synthase [Deinococcales bacterium]
MPELLHSRVVPVNVPEAYEVLVGAGLLGTLPQHVTSQQVAIICDENVATLHAGAVREHLLQAGREVELLIVEPGEASKSTRRWAQLLEQLAAAAFSRDCTVVAIGGGVVTDLGGFVAATWLRGVKFVSVPTSMLGMVDAGVGGKTGLNLKAGKNLVGAFWQPQLVLADVTVLRTLPDRQFRHGAVEFFKHALIGRPEQLKLLSDPAFGRTAAADRLIPWLADNISVKAGIVAADEREAGERMHLNLGHTFAHALEGATRHRLEHGEAVAYGILFAALLGRNRGHADLVPLGLQLLRYVRPEPLPPLLLDDLLAFMARDKKNRAGTQRFVLLREAGAPFVVDDVSTAELEAAWLQLRELVDGLDWEARN